MPISRLAQSIRPLLGESFGQEQHCLYVIKELQKEYDKNPRLKNSFPWVNNAEYPESVTYHLGGPGFSSAQQKSAAWWSC
jgi:hypothetical protein